jgi:ribonuclease HI
LLVIYTDGAARGNPGESASGYLIYRNAKILHRHSEYNGTATNNYAEYNAVLLSLEWCISSIENHSEYSIELYSDSELVIKQLNKKYKIKSLALKPVSDKVSELAKKFRKVTFKNVRREDPNISIVDKSLNALLDRKSINNSAKQ